MALTRFDERAPYNQNAELLNAFGTATQNFYAPSQGPIRFDYIWASNSDTIDHDLSLIMSVAAVPIRFGQVTVPAGAGFGTGPAIELITAYSVGTLDGLILQPNDYIGISLQVAMVGVSVLDLLLLGATL